MSKPGIWKGGLQGFKKRRNQERSKMDYKLNHEYQANSMQRMDPSWADDVKITQFMIAVSINNRYQGGSKERPIQRQCKRISDSINKAIKNERTSVELSEADGQFILDTLKEHSCHPSHMSWFVDLLDYNEKWVEEAKRRAEGPAKKPEPEPAKS